MMGRSCTKSDSSPLGTALINIPLPVTKKPSKHKNITLKLINTHAEPQLGIKCISSPDPFSLKECIFDLKSKHLLGYLIWIWVGRTKSRWGAVTRWVRQVLSLLSRGGMIQGVPSASDTGSMGDTHIPRTHAARDFTLWSYFSTVLSTHLRRQKWWNGSSNHRLKSACHVKSKNLVICIVAFSSHSKSQRSAPVPDLSACSQVWF